MKLKQNGPFLAACFLVVVVLPVDSFGADKIEPSLEVKEEYNDNIYLTDNNETDDFIATARPGLLLSRDTERYDASLAGFWNFISYSDNNELNAVNHDYTGKFSILPTEITKIEGSANYLKDSNPDRDLEVTGEVLGTTVREREHYQLSGEWNITEKSGVGANYSYSEDDYEDAGTSSYYAHIAGLGYSYNLSQHFPNTTGRLNFGYGKYEFNSSSVDNYVVTVGLDKEISEIWKLSLAAGPRFTNTEYGTVASQKNDDVGASGQASLTYNGETSTVKFLAAHEIDASSGRNGTVERSSLRVDMDRRLTEELRAGLAASYFKNKTDSDISTLTVNEHNYRIQPRVTYNFAPDLFAELSYAFTFIDDKDDNLERERNYALLRLQKKFSLLD